MIVLLTDFGNSEYTGVMKGVIKTIYHKADIIDLCNNITHQSIIEGAWVLLQNYKYFPRGTIFLCVIDPGVGSDRKPIIIESENYYFIGPDNGLMYPAANDDHILRHVHIKYLDKQLISKTFHGRDIFAKVAAKMDEKIYLQEFGDFIKEIKTHNFHRKGREGIVVRIDHFGNIVTNLPPLKKKEYNVRLTHKHLKLGFFKTYDSAPNDELFIITGSSGTLEIAVKDKRATQKMEIKVGDKLIIS